MMLLLGLVLGMILGAVIMAWVMLTGITDLILRRMGW